MYQVHSSTFATTIPRGAADRSGPIVGLMVGVPISLGLWGMIALAYLLA